MRVLENSLLYHRGTWVVLMISSEIDLFGMLAAIVLSLFLLTKWVPLSFLRDYAPEEGQRMEQQNHKGVQ